MTPAVSDHRRIIRAAAAAALLSGAPSTLEAVLRGGSLRSGTAHVVEATRAAGTLLPPGSPGLLRGAVVHVGVSAIFAEALARTLPADHALSWGAAAGLLIGLVNVGVIGRRLPAIRALPLGPQLADNMAFGLVFAGLLGRRAAGSAGS